MTRRPLRDRGASRIDASSPILEWSDLALRAGAGANVINHHKMLLHVTRHRRQQAGGAGILPALA
eukprot:CAMPEP_0115634822 /NCGR_PEP_ID=MMETSP0272-20121206/32789_1 /TAXON_ID=71861 /ORGANISM="Scrippsiella trochoidea, Strain CCMP3099" /LENGTH=64 /DNA_ID=CAMNT_0003071683 /DNA_START=211 /DNA_END=408 /DNA_ORIENTATION=-